MGDEDERGSEASLSLDEGEQKAGSKKVKRQVKKDTQLYPGRLANPPPQGYPREAIESFLKEVELQLKLVKTLLDTRSAVEDAVKVQEKVHERIKELARLADVSLATWAVHENEEEKRAWFDTTLPPKPEADPTEAQRTSYHWSPEEIALFNKALKEIDYTKRGAAKLIHQRIPTKGYIQVRDRLRRLRALEKKKETDENATPAASD